MSKEMQYWVFIFVLQVLFIAWYKGMLTPNPDAPSPDALVLTATEAVLTKQAIVAVREKVVSGEIQTTEQAVDALFSLLPRTCRGRVMDTLGEPEFGFMRDALDILEGQIEVRD